jgi:hypothetical protein
MSQPLEHTHHTNSRGDWRCDAHSNEAVASHRISRIGPRPSLVPRSTSAFSLFTSLDLQLNSHRPSQHALLNDLPTSPPRPCPWLPELDSSNRLKIENHSVNAPRHPAPLSALWKLRTPMPPPQWRLPASSFRPPLRRLSSACSNVAAASPTCGRSS